MDESRITNLKYIEDILDKDYNSLTFFEKKEINEIYKLSMTPQFSNLAVFIIHGSHYPHMKSFYTRIKQSNIELDSYFIENEIKNYYETRKIAANNKFFH